MCRLPRIIQAACTHIGQSENIIKTNRSKHSAEYIMNTLSRNPSAAPTAQQVADTFKILSNHERLHILLILLEHDSSLQELSEATGLSTAKTAAHLQKMRKLGIVDYTRFMRIMQYRITSDITRNLLNALPQFPKDRT